MKQQQWILRDFRPAQLSTTTITQPEAPIQVPLQPQQQPYVGRPPPITFNKLFNRRLPSVQRPRIAHARFGGSQFQANTKKLATTGQHGMIVLDCTIDNWSNDPYFQSQPGLYAESERMYVNFIFFISIYLNISLYLYIYLYRYTTHTRTG